MHSQQTLTRKLPRHIIYAFLGCINGIFVIPFSPIIALYKAIRHNFFDKHDNVPYFHFSNKMPLLIIKGPVFAILEFLFYLVYAPIYATKIYKQSKYWDSYMNSNGEEITIIKILQYGRKQCFSFFSGDNVSLLSVLIDEDNNKKKYLIPNGLNGAFLELVIKPTITDIKIKQHSKSSDIKGETIILTQQQLTDEISKVNDILGCNNDLRIPQLQST